MPDVHCIYVDNDTLLQATVYYSTTSNFSICSAQNHNGKIMRKI